MKLNVINENTKDIYKDFCEREKKIPIFSNYWWLESVKEDGDWDVIIVTDGNGQIMATFPYYIKEKKNISRICMPKLTQKMGPWLNEKIHCNLSLEKQVYHLIISNLPKYHFFIQAWDHKYRNWLPLYWRGFSQTTKYTYIIKDIINSDIVYKNFDHSKKKQIKKAQSQNFKIIKNISAREFYDHHEYTLRKNNKKISYSFPFFLKIYEESINRDQGAVFAVYSKDKSRFFCALFVIYDNEYAYNLISTIDPDYSDNGASTLAVYEALLGLKNKVKHFDFEGSMIEPVERSFRKFGAKQTEYFCISKEKSKLLQFIKNTKKLLTK